MTDQGQDPDSGMDGALSEPAAVEPTTEGAEDFSNTGTAEGPKDADAAERPPAKPGDAVAPTGVPAAQAMDMVGGQPVHDGGRSPARRRRIPLVAATVVVVLLVAGAVFLLRGGNDEGEAGGGSADRQLAGPVAVLESPSGMLTSVAFSQDGTLLASAGIDGTLQLWDTATHEPGKAMEAGGLVRDVAFSPDGPLLAAGTNSTMSGGGSITLWDTATREATSTMGGFTPLEPIGTLASLSFSPDGRLLAGAEDNNVRLWNMETRTPRITLATGDSDEVHSVAFSPDSRLLAIGVDQSVEIWDVTVKRLEQVSILDQGNAARAVAFAPDGTLLASASGEGVRLWDAGTYEPVATLADGDRDVLSLAFSPDGNLLATGHADGATDSVQIWDVAARELAATLEHGNHVDAVTFAPQSDLLATAGGTRATDGGVAENVDDTVRLWDTIGLANE